MCASVCVCVCVLWWEVDRTHAEKKTKRLEYKTIFCCSLFFTYFWSSPVNINDKLQYITNQNCAFCEF